MPATRRMTSRIEVVAPRSLADAVTDAARSELLTTSAWCRRVLAQAVNARPDHARAKVAGAAQ
jgi:hypothetical protein